MDGRRRGWLLIAVGCALAAIALYFATDRVSWSLPLVAAWFAWRALRPSEN